MNSLRIHIDEAWRGPLAGPVFVWLTMSLQDFDKSPFKDSKQLTQNKRAAAYTLLYKHEEKGHVLCASGWASAKEIDKLGIISSLQLASCRWLFHLLKKYFSVYRQQALIDSVHGEDTIAERALRKHFSKNICSKETLSSIIHIPNSVCSIVSLLIDGNHTFWLDTTLDIRVITIIKWDTKNPLISAASIIAKEERDSYMSSLPKKYTPYTFSQHKWYGTKQHRSTIAQYGISPLHRVSFCQNIKLTTKAKKQSWKSSSTPRVKQTINNHLIDNTAHIQSKDASQRIPTSSTKEKPWLLLHICCAPDLTWPLHRLKRHFKLYLFRYNPNIHPRTEHEKRYASFLRLIGLEKGDYEIIEDRYDPKEFFAAMIEEREDIDPKLKHATAKAVLAQAGEMEERSSRCNPCYSMRLAEAAKNAEKHNIEYFTSTLLISPKKKMDKLMRRWLEWERRYPNTKFLRFDFAKNKGYEKATILTKKHKLFRQNYCGCGWTIPKKGEEDKEYRGG